MSAEMVRWIGAVQMLLVIPKVWMAVREPRRRTWHILSGAIIGILGLIMFIQDGPR